MPHLQRCLALALSLLLAACASGPTFETAGVERTLTPVGVSAAPQTASGRTVLWGGVILNTTNLDDSTRIEVLAYPLDSSEWPQQERDPLGRFILVQSGYLEPASYAEGRLVTATGTITGNMTGRVGASDYTYPVISARQLYLWPRERARDRTRVIFGLGVGIGL
ncbi:MAG: Slp family lipoprotein [Pseudomonadota bacterium]